MKDHDTINSQSQAVPESQKDKAVKTLQSFVNIVDAILGDLNEKETNGKKFSQEFQFDGIPLWWFYRRLITSHVLPKQFNTPALVKKQKINPLEKGYYQLLRLAFQRYIHYNERIKVRIVDKTKKQPEKYSKKKRVLFLTYTSHINKKSGELYRINSILNLLKEEDQVEPFTLFADPISGHSYKEIKKMENTIYHYVGKDEQEQAKKISKEMYSKWTALPKEGLFGNKWENLQPTLDFFFSREFMYHSILYYLATKRALQEQSVQCIVITATTGFFERCMIAAAAKLDVPLVIIQHGEGLATSDPELFPGMKVAIGVFGEKFADRLMKWGIDRKDIEIIGPIAFEEIYSFVQKEQKKTDKILLITTSLIEGNRLSKEEYFQNITSILRQLSVLQKEIVIKLHPAERNFDHYVKIIEKEGWKNMKVTQERGQSVLYTLINDSDIVVNLYSTVALQAMILGKPVVSMDIVLPTVPNADDGIWNGGIQVTKHDDLTKAAAEALLDPPHWKKKRQETVESYCYKVDGKENERLRDLIYKMS